MLGILTGLVISNVSEWLAHRYILHGLGKNKDSIWHFHLAEHHKEARLHNFYDYHYHDPPSFKGKPSEWNAQTKETAALIGLAILHLPLLPIFPFYTMTVWWYLRKYYTNHKRAHMDPEWAKVNLPHHWYHHMGNQNKNWNVVYGWMDTIMGTATKE